MGGFFFFSNCVGFFFFNHLIIHLLFIIYRFVHSFVKFVYFFTSFLYFLTKYVFMIDIGVIKVTFTTKFMMEQTCPGDVNTARFLSLTWQRFDPEPYFTNDLLKCGISVSQYSSCDRERQLVSTFNIYKQSRRNGLLELK